MEPISSFLTVSISIGGAVFVCLVVFWFIAIYLKRRVAGSSASTSPAALASGLSSWDEKRVHQRLAVSWPASLQAPSGKIQCRIRDISQGGAFVACAQPLGLGSHFRIAIAPPNGSPMELNAEVVWSNQNVPAEQVVNRGMGVRFINNDETQRRHLSEAIAGLLRAAEPGWNADAMPRRSTAAVQRCARPKRAGVRAAAGSGGDIGLIRSTQS